MTKSRGYEGGISEGDDDRLTARLCARVVTRIIRYVSRRYIIFAHYQLARTLIHVPVARPPAGKTYKPATRGPYDIFNSRLILERRFSAKSRHEVTRRTVCGTVVRKVLIFDFSFPKRKGSSHWRLIFKMELEAAPFFQIKTRPA